jgi:hypothetical protein
MAAIRHVDVTRLKAGTRILVETAGKNCVWAFKVVDPELAMVEVYGTDPNFKDSRPVKGMLLQAYEPVQGGSNLPHCLVKDWNFQVRFANVVLVGGPVESARVEGPGWSYEAFE